MAFEEGSLLAVAYDERGQEVVRQERKSFGDAVRIEARADRDSMPADGRSL